MTPQLYSLIILANDRRHKHCDGAAAIMSPLSPMRTAQPSTPRQSESKPRAQVRVWQPKNNLKPYQPLRLPRQMKIGSVSINVHVGDERKGRLDGNPMRPLSVPKPRLRCKEERSTKRKMGMMILTTEHQIKRGKCVPTKDIDERSSHICALIILPCYSSAGASGATNARKE